MSIIGVANEHISIELQLGSEQDPVPSGGIEVTGISIKSIIDVKNGHNYLKDFQAPTSLFEFTVNNKGLRVDPPNVQTRPISSQDLTVTRLTELHPDETITVSADAPDRKLSFELVLRSNPDDADPVIILSLTVTNHHDKSIFLRSVFPKIYWSRTNGNSLSDAVGMVSIEIGSVVPLQPLSVEIPKLDDLDHKPNPNTMGMPYRIWAKRIGLPTSMNTMELASIYDPKGGGGLFFADIGHPGVVPNQFAAPIQFTLSIDGVDGFWIAEVPPSQAVEFPQLAIGVHHEGDWHKPVDYYVGKHRKLWNPPPEAPAWFRDQGAIYTFAGGGAGGIYLELAKANLQNGAIWTFFKNDNPHPWPMPTDPLDPQYDPHPWLPFGPIPLTKAQLAPPGASTAAIARPIARQGKDEDVFFVGNDGSICWTFMRDNGPWQPAQPITEPHFAKPGGHLAAVARNDLQIDVFVVRDKDQDLWTLFKVGDDQAEWDRTNLSEGDIAPSGAAIAAITRHGRDVDVFLIGMGGELRWTRERNNMPWLETPERITEEDFALPGGNLAALARNPSQTDVFVVNLQRQIATVFKTEARDDAPWEILSLDKPLAKSGAGIAAVVREDKD